MAKTTDSLYRHYTDSEIDAANDIDLPELLSSLGYQVRRVGSYYTTKEMDSLRIKGRRIWYRYSESIGGDAIAFLRHFCGMSFHEAVSYLLAFNAYPQPIQRSRPPPERERPVFVLPPPNGDNKRVCAYLRRRGIAPSVIDSFIESGLLYEEAKYHNCVFVGRNSDNKPVFAAKRGIYDMNGAPFRAGVPGSDKGIGFRLPSDSAVDRVHVFEAPIDLMSFCTLHRDVTRNAVALCGLYEGPLDTYLRENPGVKRIFLCLDADRRGKEAAERMKDKYSEQGYAVSYEPPPCRKDWNEYLQMKGETIP